MVSAASAVFCIFIVCTFFMAVYTDVSDAEAQTLVDALQLGQLTALEGISGGIENSNFFMTVATEGQPETYVLTLFERLSHEQLPYYLRLMQHLADKGLAVPAPVANADGEILHTVAGKPAAVVSKLSGKSQLAPTAHHCQSLGGTLARMHLAGADFAMQQPNLRALDWWNNTVPEILPHLTPAQAALLGQELAFQNHIQQLPAYAATPAGPVHADLFRDNAMFDGDTLTGVFDFYFAGNDRWLFDLCVCLNDWCTDLSTGQWDDARLSAMLTAYQTVRPLTAAERALINPMLRAAALRFWISRLWDYYLPREASLLTPHDPTHFERIITQRRLHPVYL
jgi:homoserine kinase type II